MDHFDIKRTAETFSKLHDMISNNEQLSLALFAAKLEKAAEQYPDDYTIGAVADTLDRMSISKAFISRAELKDLYKRLYSRNTKFASVFADELGVVKTAETPVVKTAANDDTYSLVQRAYEKVNDPILANALNQAFGGPTMPYTAVSAEKARTVCSTKLASMGLKAKLEVSAGNDELLVCTATFATPKGFTSILIPVEFADNHALLPSVFVSNAGSNEFSDTNLKQYILKNAGVKLANINAQLVFQAASSIKNPSQISDVDVALTKLNASKEQTAEFSHNQVVHQKLYDVPQNLTVKTPTYSNKEVSVFAKQFETPVGFASFSLGETTVKLATDLVSNYLRSFGFIDNKVVIADSDKNSITYAVMVDGGKIAFKVPVKIENGRALAPTVLFANGGIDDFSVAGINRVIKAGRMDSKIVAIASTFGTLPVGDLVEAVRLAVQAKNYSKAEEAIMVLAESNDQKAYQAALEAFKEGLIAKPVEKVAQCSNVVKNANSQYELCGHLGIPLHKTFIDKHGSCAPLYRKTMADTSDGTVICSGKVLI